MSPTPAERFPRFADGSLIALMAILFLAILTVWMPEPWIPRIFEAAFFSLAAAWATRIAISPGSSRFSLALALLAAPILIGALQLAMSSTVNRWQTWAALLRWGAYLAAAFGALQVCSSGRIQVRFRRALLYFGFAVAVVSVLQFFTSPEKVFWLFEGEFAEPSLGPFVSRDRYAAFVELLLPLALFEAFAGKQVAVSYTAMAATMLASVIAGASRAGSILVLVESAAVLLLMSRSRVFRSRKAGRVAASYLLLAVVFTAVVGWTHLWDRFKDPDPYRYRREMLASSITMVRARPWTGFGLGTFETVYPAYALFDTGELVNHAHNDWAEWAVEGGLPLLLVLLPVAVVAARMAFQRPWLIGVLSVLIHSAVDFPMQEPVLALWVFALFGAGLAEAGASRGVGFIDDTAK
jgi:O-antigen ligase